MNCIKAVIAEINAKKFKVSGKDGRITQRDYREYMRQEHPDKVKARIAAGSDERPSEYFNQITSSECKKLVVGKSLKELYTMSGEGPRPSTSASASASSRCDPTSLCSVDVNDVCFPERGVKSSLLNPSLDSSALQKYFDMIGSRSLPGTKPDEYFNFEMSGMTGIKQNLVSHPTENMGSIMWRYFSYKRDGTWMGVKYQGCEFDFAHMATLSCMFPVFGGSLLAPTSVHSGDTATGFSKNTWLEVAESWKTKRLHELQAMLSSVKEELAQGRQDVQKMGDEYNRKVQQIEQQRERGRAAGAAAMLRKLRGDAGKQWQQAKTKRDELNAKRKALQSEINWLTGPLHLPTILKDVVVSVLMEFPSSALIARPEPTLGHPNRSNEWTNGIVDMLNPKKAVSWFQ